MATIASVTSLLQIPGALVSRNAVTSKPDSSSSFANLRKCCWPRHLEQLRRRFQDLIHTLLHFGKLVSDLVQRIDRFRTRYLLDVQRLVALQHARQNATEFLRILTELSAAMTASSPPPSTLLTDRTILSASSDWRCAIAICSPGALSVTSVSLLSNILPAASRHRIAQHLRNIVQVQYRLTAAQDNVGILAHLGPGFGY